MIALDAIQAGGHQLWSELDRAFVATLMWNTVRLAAVVTLFASVLGTGAAWLTERTSLPGRRVWAVFLVVPFVVPDFVLAWAWSSILPSVHGYWGAVLVMTLHLYPLVYLPMAAAFRAADPALEEAARVLGSSRLSAWWRVSVRGARTTLLGASLLVCLALLSYYGGFEDLRYQTFTTAIFGELQTRFAPGTASSLSLVLVGMSVLLLVAEASFRERAVTGRSGAGVSRAQRPVDLGRAQVLAIGGLAVLVGFALGFPVAVVAYWFATTSSAASGGASLWGAAGYSALYSSLGAGVATAASLPVALLAHRRPRRWTAAVERSTFIVQAIPGVVVALALVYLAERFAPFLYQSPEMLVASYAIMFFPLALVAVSSSVARASVRLEDVGRSLGKGPLAVRASVTLPMLAPGMLAAFCFVFLSAATELTATLILVPTGVQTLATQFWAHAEQGLSFGAAAPFAAMMMAMSALPAFFLGRWFDRTVVLGRGSAPPPVVSGVGLSAASPVAA